nr:hypothetical protein [Mucilaginibacter sp. FT3.2]
MPETMLIMDINNLASGAYNWFVWFIRSLYPQLDKIAIIFIQYCIFNVDAHLITLPR